MERSEFDKIMPGADVERLKQLTNVEFLEQLMTFSIYGGLVAQAVVIEAIRSHCEHVTSGETDPDDNGLISKEAWVGCCKDLLLRIEDKYGKRQEG